MHQAEKILRSHKSTSTADNAFVTHHWIPGIQAADMSTHLPQDEGLVLVRRFTDELKGDTALERAAISAQQYQDETEKEVRRRRMEALYKGSDRQSK